MYLEAFIPELETLWDRFILEENTNGTFIHTRKFIQYHPAGKFQDASLLIQNRRGAIIGMIPACTIMNGDEQVLYSHRGCTYGGIILKARHLKVAEIQEILGLLREYGSKNGYQKIVIKFPSELYSGYPVDGFIHIGIHQGWKLYTELNTYIDFNRYDPDILSNFSQGKRTHVNRCIALGLVFRELQLKTEVRDFHEILKKSLEKYETLPVHTPEEILDFTQERIPQFSRLFGVFMGREMIAGAMVYLYPRTRCVYTTYLAAMNLSDRNNPQLKTLSPGSFLYYSVIKWAQKAGYKYVSFGISTENMGKVMNYGLVANKEAYGSLHSIHPTLELIL